MHLYRNRLGPVAFFSLTMLYVQQAVSMPDAWVTYVRLYSDHSIYLFHSGTSEARLLVRWSGSDPDLPVFSPNGRKIAFMADGAVWTINNDGTGQNQVCSMFPGGGLRFANLCWTTQGLFWTQNTRDIYYADPGTGQSKVLGTLTANTTGNMLRMSFDGTRAYLRTDHEIGDKVGSLFFEVAPGLSGIINERVFGASLWDHGSAMLGDGSAAIWIVWNCGVYSTPGCGSHQMFAYRHFSDMSFTTFFPNDGFGATHDLSGPGNGPYTSHSAPNHMLYRRGCTEACCVGCNGWDQPHYMIMDLGTGELMEVTPDPILSGPVASMGRLYKCGEFWLGALPDPHASSPAIGLDKSQLLFSDQTTPIAPDTVTVNNIGAGTLGTVSVNVLPAAAWLSLQVTGGGNRQYLVATVSESGLAPGDHSTTVTVDGGGAGNSESFTVTLSIGTQLFAPSSLYSSLQGESVVLNWTDNSDDETGFTIERRDSGGAFAPLAVAPANDSVYVDSTTVQGATYEYRMRATDGANYSSYSDTLAVNVPLPPVIVTGPTENDVWTAGQQHHITWSAPALQIIQIDISYDNEENWNLVTDTGGVSKGGPNWGDYTWTVPDTLGAQPHVLIRVAEYLNVGTYGLSRAFSIAPSSGASTGRASRLRRLVRFEIRTDGTDIVLSYALPGGMTPEAVFYNTGGKEIASVRGRSGSAEGGITWRPSRTLGSGLYVARLFGVDNAGSRKLLGAEVVPLRR